MITEMPREKESFRKGGDGPGKRVPRLPFPRFRLPAFLPRKDGVEVRKEPFPQGSAGQRLDMPRPGGDPQLLRLFGEAVEPFPVPDGNDFVRFSVEDEEGYGPEAPDPAAAGVSVPNGEGGGGRE